MEVDNGCIAIGQKRNRHYEVHDKPEPIRRMYFESFIVSMHNRLLEIKGIINIGLYFYYAYFDICISGKIYS